MRAGGLRGVSKVEFLSVDLFSFLSALLHFSVAVYELFLNTQVIRSILCVYKYIYVLYSHLLSIL